MRILKYNFQIFGFPKNNTISVEVVKVLRYLPAFSFMLYKQTH